MTVSEDSLKHKGYKDDRTRTLLVVAGLVLGCLFIVTRDNAASYGRQQIWGVQSPNKYGKAAALQGDHASTPTLQDSHVSTAVRQDTSVSTTVLPGSHATTAALQDGRPSTAVANVGIAASQDSRSSTAVQQGGHASTASLPTPAGFVTGSATSGKTFQGNVIRRYTGSKLFAGSPKPLEQPLPPSSQQQQQQQPNSLKWAVCTTIFEPSKPVMDMLQVKGWHVVVVGDKGAAPYNVSAPNLVYLGEAAQQQMGQQHADLLKLLPWKHFGRKNLGFLYAFSHGAEMVWDFDDDNGLKTGLKEPQVPEAEVYNVVTGRSCQAFNPYPLMGAPKERVDAWPRGFPLELLKTPCQHVLTAGNTRKVAVVQSLADHEPDVDALFRLTRQIPFEFAANSKRTLVISPGTLAPYNAQATLVLKPAFFTQLLPVTVHGRVSDIWRSYIGQRLLWDTGSTIAFAPPMVTQLRNPHNLLADMQSEEPLYYKAGSLVRRLLEWDSSAETLPGKYEDLVIDLYERGYVEQQDIYLSQQWILALQRIGYDFPTLLPRGRVLWGGAAAVPTQRKAAICVSGQLRTVEATIGNITKHVFDVVGDYDVFVYVQTRGSAHEPRVGDTKACSVFESAKHPNAQVFCKVEQEQPVKVDDYIPAALQKTYWYGSNYKYLNGLTQQLLGLQGCWNMAAEHSITTNTQYKYFLRLRPDNAVFDPIPPLEVFSDTHALYIPSIKYHCCGNEDIFSVSSWEVAEQLMNRLPKLQEQSVITQLQQPVPAWGPKRTKWIAEDLVRAVMQDANYTVVDYPDLHVHVRRRPGHADRGGSEP